LWLENMDLGIFGGITFDWDFLTRLISIVIIDLILAGDNAVVIAMAVRSLPPHQRKKGIIFGAGAAVGLRVLCAFFVAQMLTINFLKPVGGALPGGKIPNPIRRRTDASRRSSQRWEN